MAGVAETQFTGWRLHKRRGEALPYYNAISAASLPTPYSTLNVAARLPSGTYIAINAQPYVTRNSIDSGDWGEMDPLNWHPTYIVPKKSADSFADRAAVYWDATNSYATSTPGGNQLIGYAVSNGDIGSATNGTSSALSTVGSASGCYSIGSGTSADGLVGAYTSGDTFVEVELVLAATVTTAGSFGTNATTTATGTSQASAAALTANTFTVVAGGDGTVGVVLPAGLANRSVTVKNNSATSALWVYPATTAAINAITAASAYSMAAKTTATFIAQSVSQWYTVPLVAS